MAHFRIYVTEVKTCLTGIHTPVPAYSLNVSKLIPRETGLCDSHNVKHAHDHVAFPFSENYAIWL